MHWLRGGNSMEDAISDLEAFNAPQDVIDDLRAKQRDDDFNVWPENWEFVCLFLRLQTQWRMSFGGFVGLDYNAIAFVFDISNIANKLEAFEALQVMERAALAKMNEAS